MEICIFALRIYCQRQYSSSINCGRACARNKSWDSILLVLAANIYLLSLSKLKDQNIGYTVVEIKAASMRERFRSFSLFLLIKVSQTSKGLKMLLN